MKASFETLTGSIIPFFDGSERFDLRSRDLRGAEWELQDYVEQLDWPSMIIARVYNDDGEEIASFEM